MSKAKEFRDQSLEELKATYQEQCKQLFELNHAFKYQKKEKSRTSINMLVKRSHVC